MVLTTSMHFFEELRKVLGVLSWPVCSTPSWQPPSQVMGGSLIDKEPHTIQPMPWSSRTLLSSFILLAPGQVSLIPGRGGKQTEYIPILLSYVLVGEGSQPDGAEGTGEGAPGGCGSHAPHRGVLCLSPPVPSLRQLLAASCLLAPCSFSPGSTQLSAQ